MCKISRARKIQAQEFRPLLLVGSSLNGYEQDEVGLDT